jgi:hypothetical protein
MMTLVMMECSTPVMNTVEVVGQHSGLRQMVNVSIFSKKENLKGVPAILIQHTHFPKRSFILPDIYTFSLPTQLFYCS